MDNPIIEEEKDIPIKTPKDLISNLLRKDKNLTYKEEEKGRSINFLHIHLETDKGKADISIYRKSTHIWDIPAWNSRSTYSHKKQVYYHY